MKTLPFVAASLALVVSTVGCGQVVVADGTLSTMTPAALNTRENMHAFSLADARTLGLFFGLSPPMPLPSDGAPTCPSRSVQGDTVTYRGGCAQDNTRYEGVLIVRGDAVRGTSQSIEYQDWSQVRTESADSATPETRTMFRGSSRVTVRGAVRDFEIDVIVTGFQLVPTTGMTRPTNVAISYRGTVDFSGSDSDMDGLGDIVRASGSGRVGIAPYGRVETVTRDLVYDRARCIGEPLSGTLELRGAQVAMLTYDGATRCGLAATRTAPYTLDGAAAGEVNVAYCSISAAPGRGPVGWLGALAMGLGALVVRGRRGRARPESENPNARR
jgi:hypothetical protein